MITLEKNAALDVVLVEANEDEAKLSLMGLKRINPQPTVLLVKDGEEALSLFTGPAPVRAKVVLLDLKLPKVHGLDILAAIKDSSDVQELSVVVLTSSDHPSDVKRARELGCTDYLCKPFDWEKYVQLVCCEVASRLKNSECPDAKDYRRPYPF